MPHSPNIDQLANDGIVDPNKVTPDAQKVIDNLTPPELAAIKSMQAKVDPKNRANSSNMIQMAGF